MREDPSGYGIEHEDHDPALWRVLRLVDKTYIARDVATRDEAIDLALADRDAQPNNPEENP